MTSPYEARGPGGTPICARCPHEAGFHGAHDNSCRVENCACDGFAERLPPGVGVAVLVWRGDELLFHLRKGKHGPGTWSFPGGHVDWGESPFQAAIRELVEECGPGMVCSEPLPYQRCPYVSTMFASGKQYITLYFEARLVSGEPQVMEPEKCAEWKFFHAKTLPSPLFDPLENKRLDLASALDDRHLIDSSSDEGETKIAIGVDRDHVVMHFGKPMHWLGLDPEGARSVADNLTKFANHIKPPRS